MLPHQGGLETLRFMRRDGYNLPILILTSKDSIEDRVLGLDAGADDYMVKPFAFPELLARLRALLRRTNTVSVTHLEIADLSMDLSGRVATRQGKVLDLTSREFDLLEYFLLNRGHVVSREMLTRDVWRETLRYTSLDNVIDVQIARLRRKVDDPYPRKLLPYSARSGLCLAGGGCLVRLRPRHLRGRLTLWYVITSGMVLVAFICVASALQYWQFTRQIYHAEIQDIETSEGLLYFDVEGGLKLHEEYYNYPQNRLLLDRLMDVLALDGKVLFRNEKLGGRDLDGPPFPGEGRFGYNERSAYLPDGERVLMISHIHSVQGRPGLIRLGYSTEILRHRLGEFIGLLLLAC